MKLTLQTLTLLLFSVLLFSCHCNTGKRLKGSLIQIDSAIIFRNNYLYYPNSNYHIAQAYMFETAEFDALFHQMTAINKIRLYPAINTHYDILDDTLTLIMVPVNAGTGKDNLTNYIFEYAEMCPNNCNHNGYFPAPTELALNLNIPKNWCVDRKVIENVITQGELVVGAGNVYGIRFYWYTNAKGIMDLELKPTTVNNQNIENIGELSFKDVTQICTSTGKGDCCDTQSRLYQKHHRN
jgi:hypothetical protein